MTLIEASIKGTTLVLRHRGKVRDEQVHIHWEEPQEYGSANLYGGNYPVYDAGNLAASWLSDILERPCRLVRKDPDVARPVNMRTNAYSGEVAFADSAPFLGISVGSLSILNKRHGSLVSTLAIRPSIVVSGEPHSEDTWEQRIVTIGSVRMFCTSLCYRCEMVDVDYDTGTYKKGVLRTLAQYRRIKLPDDNRVFLGVRLVPLNTGFIQIGDPVSVCDV